ncbi:TonB-dependent receptor [Marinimicrobium koreense]|uniref:TonB-dependent receptor n=1 Tax=Marinimicrobium koreense TaxID=306545 RepID=UPI003F6E4707
MIAKKTILSSTIATILFAGAQASAQSASQEAGMEEVLVTGIRSSLQQAMDIKRDSDAMVDSIASESLGKFPDTNIAESLQRITGVSIDRSGGEGQSVTVRGFGPQFNTVLLNGRRQVSDTGARSFNFDNLPAELVSRVDVYKSAQARLQSGGIGSTIVMHTPRPLDIGSFKAVGSAKMLHEDLSGESTPELFGMVSNTFADGRMGALLSVTYEERKNRIERFLTDGILTAPRDGLTLIADDLADQGYSADDQFFIPQVLNISPIDEQRERININSTFQFQATDDLTFTLDAMFNDFDVQTQSNTLTFFVTPSIITDATFDENRTATTFTQNQNAATDFTMAERSRPSESQAFGFNADWDLAPGWNVAFDTSYSKAESGGAGGTNVGVIGFRDDGFTLSYDENGMPSYSGVTDAQINDTSLSKAHFFMRGIGGGPLGGAADIEHDLFEQRVDFEWQADFEHLKTITFGAHYSDESESTTSRTSDNPCIYCGYQTDVPDDLLAIVAEGGNYMDGDIDVPATWQTADLDALISWLETPEAAAARDEAAGLEPGTTQAALDESNGYALVLQSSSTEIDETVMSVYANFNFQGELGDMPWSLNAGVRYVETETTPFGISAPLLDLREIPSDPTAYDVVDGNEQVVSANNTYDHFLPTLDYRLNLNDDMVIRFAASQTLTRPPFGALSPRTTIGTARPGNLQASSGNPNLEPYASDNLDLAYEWYYQESGYLTVGLFQKRVENFLVNTVLRQEFEIQDQDNLFDGNPVFEVSTQDNLEDATVDGVELGFQHTFDYLSGVWSGFGFTANATLVDSDAELDTGDISQTFALEGLGDSYNIVGFYERGNFEARLAWNQRDRFLQTAVGFGGEPTYVEDYEQIDARVSYSLSDSLSVFAEGVNITDEKYQKVGRYDNQILLREQTGPRYTVGVRAEF